MAKYNPSKNIEKTDWSINKNIEKRVKKLSFDLENVQVLCLNKICLSKNVCICNVNQLLKKHSQLIHITLNCINDNLNF